jgi:2,3-bisphosphoglycerate-independent phosphoglycerate mutase
MTTSPTNSPLLLIVRDGWGQNPNPSHDSFNAIKLADTPVADRLDRDWPSTLIKTSGEDVGLDAGKMGNSEVGHQNIGAGRIVDQDAVRISKAARLNSFKTNTVLAGAISTAASRGGAVHLMGIASDAGVHGLLTHLYACLDLCKHLGATRVYLHCFTDGRDTGPFTGKGYVEQIESKCKEIGVGEIASIIGRYWSMDRDNRWERIALSYTCLTGQGARKADVPISASATEAIQRFYDEPVEPNMRGDEFITPTMIGDDVTAALAKRITNNDTVIYYNYRGDRPRELVRAFVLPEFEGSVDPSPDTGAKGFDRGPKLSLRFVGMSPYAQDLLDHMDVAFPKPPKMVNIMGSYLADKDLPQFRCAETEKFPHVTFFFNDYRDDPFPGEHRAIIQSPMVSTYDQQPEMSAAGVRDAVLERLRADDCEPVIVVNFANPDMVGHTGNLDAVVKAVEFTDRCVGELLEELERVGGVAIVTADHGNAEQMWNPEIDAPHTSHTTYDVPLYVVGKAFRGRSLRDGGRLADIVPTGFAMLGLEQPAEMTGASLLA